MTFEEFFKRKRIDLVALQAAEPALFSEFKTHFDQMGEKSFDHTKKYWFNKLRLLYHLAAELKPEKVHIENRLAEQTITESILEEKMPAPSVSFKPIEAESEKPKAESPVETTPKPAGFTPRFKAGVTKPNTESAESEEPKAEIPADATPKPAGFTPRFKAGVTKPKTEATESEQPKAESPDKVAPKPAGFTPRFKAGVTKPKPAETERLKVDETPSLEAQAPAAETEQEKPDAEAAPPKPVVFKPRFNMKMAKPKPPEEE